MPRSVLLDESKDTHWPLGFPWAGDKIRLQDTLAMIFDAARPATIGKGDFLLHSTLKSLLIADIINGDFRRVHNTLGVLLGLGGTHGKPQNNREVGAGFDSLPDVVGQALSCAKKPDRPSTDGKAR